MKKVLFEFILKIVTIIIAAVPVCQLFTIFGVSMRIISYIAFMIGFCASILWDIDNYKSCRK